MTHTSKALTISATTNIDAGNYTLSNFYATSNLTSWTAAIYNLIDGATTTIDYQKTTASTLNITFPAGTVISVGSDAIVSGTTAALTSSSSGRYTVTIINMNGVYKVYIVQDAF